MAASYVLTLHAQEDIDTEADKIDDVDAAIRWVDDIHDVLESLGQTQGLGHRRPDITNHDVWFWTFWKRWAVIFQKGAQISVIRVVPWSLVSMGFWFGAGW